MLLDDTDGIWFPSMREEERRGDLAGIWEPLESTETYIEVDCFGMHPWGHIYHNEGKSNVQLSWLERETG